MSRRFSMLAAVALTGLMACGTGEVSPPDAGGGDGDAGPKLGDGGVPTGTLLRFEIELKPKLPADVGGPYRLQIEEVTFQLANVRAIGDSAPGDERTTLPMLQLDWLESDTEEIDFPNAPPGIYSTFIANVMRYRIRGEVDLPGPGGDHDFEIDDSPPGLQTITIALDGKRLEAGSPKTIKVDVEIGDALENLPWETYPIDEDEIEVENGDSEIVDIRNAVFSAFMPK